MSAAAWASTAALVAALAAAASPLGAQSPPLPSLLVVAPADLAAPLPDLLAHRQRTGVRARLVHLPGRPSTRLDSFSAPAHTL